MLLNNMCEIFNGKLIDGRDKPIISALEYIREYMMRRMVSVQKVIDKCVGPLTPTGTSLLEKIQEKAQQLKCIFVGNDMYQVTGTSTDQYVVNMKEKTCTCRAWELTGMPCKHAVSAIWDMIHHGQKVKAVEHWVHPCYWLSTWQEMYKVKVVPINGRDMWAKSSCPTTITPPTHHKQVGRPKKKRTRGAEEVVSQPTQGGKLSRKFISVTCGKCGNKGHNSRSCKGQGGASEKPTAKGKAVADKPTTKGKAVADKPTAKGKGAAVKSTAKGKGPEKGKGPPKGKGKAAGKKNPAKGQGVV